MTTLPLVQNLDLGDAYETLFDALGRAYWDASDIASKDLIHGAQEAVGDILTAIDEQQLADNTALYVQLGPKIQATNQALKTIQASINSITKNINTATIVVSAISKVLALFPG